MACLGGTKAKSFYIVTNKNGTLGYTSYTTQDILYVCSKYITKWIIYQIGIKLKAQQQHQNNLQYLCLYATQIVWNVIKAIIIAWYNNLNHILLEKKPVSRCYLTQKYEHNYKCGLVYRLHNGCPSKERFVLQPYKVTNVWWKREKKQRKWEINATIILVANTQFLFKTSMRIIEAWNWELRSEESREGVYEFQMSSCSSEAIIWWFVWEK